MDEIESERLDPYYRSMQLLRNTVNGSDSLQWDDAEYGKVEIFARGMSRRWYRINAHQLAVDITNEKIMPHWTSSWVICVRGAAWRSDFANEISFTVSICIHTNKSGSRLPIGDSLVSLCLSLVNDKTTAMNIPLLAQFIVCPRTRLSAIEIFQEEGIVTTDMLQAADDYFDVWEEDWEEEEEAHFEFLNQQNAINAYFAQLSSQPEISADVLRMEDEIKLKEEKMVNDYEKMIYDHERAADRVADRDAERQY
jgi:hypothetical protein